MNLIVHPPRLLKMLFPRFIWKINTSEKALYLTFDDGPIPELTHWILDKLKEYNAKATFFCVGDNVRKYPEIYKALLDEGHTTGNHTFSHLNGWKNPDSVFISDIQKADQYIISDLFRPPHGKLRKTQTIYLSRKNKRIILWDVLTRDYDKKLSKQECLNTVINYASKGSIIVLHDNIKAEKNMKYTLTETLKRFTDNGYVFKSIPQFFDLNVIDTKYQIAV